MSSLFGRLISIRSPSILYDVIRKVDVNPKNLADIALYWDLINDPIRKGIVESAFLELLEDPYKVRDLVDQLLMEKNTVLNSSYLAKMLVQLPTNSALTAYFKESPSVKDSFMELLTGDVKPCPSRVKLKILYGRMIASPDPDDRLDAMRELSSSIKPEYLSYIYSNYGEVAFKESLSFLLRYKSNDFERNFERLDPKIQRLVEDVLGYNPVRENIWEASGFDSLSLSQKVAFLDTLMAYDIRKGIQGYKLLTNEDILRAIVLYMDQPSSYHQGYPYGTDSNTTSEDVSKSLKSLLNKVVDPVALIEYVSYKPHPYELHLMEYLILRDTSKLSEAYDRMDEELREYVAVHLSYSGLTWEDILSTAPAPSSKEKSNSFSDVDEELMAEGIPYAKEAKPGYNVREFYKELTGRDLPLPRSSNRRELSTAELRAIEDEIVSGSSNRSRPSERKASSQVDSNEQSSKEVPPSEKTTDPKVDSEQSISVEFDGSKDLVVEKGPLDNVYDVVHRDRTPKARENLSVEYSGRANIYDVVHSSSEDVSTDLESKIVSLESVDSKDQEKAPSSSGKSPGRISSIFNVDGLNGFINRDNKSLSKPDSILNKDNEDRLFVRPPTKSEPVEESSVSSSDGQNEKVDLSEEEYIKLPKDLLEKLQGSDENDQPVFEEVPEFELNGEVEDDSNTQSVIEGEEDFSIPFHSIDEDETNDAPREETEDESDVSEVSSNTEEDFDLEDVPYELLEDLGLGEDEQGSSSSEDTFKPVEEDSTDSIVSGDRSEAAESDEGPADPDEGNDEDIIELNDDDIVEVVDESSNSSEPGSDSSKSSEPNNPGVAVNAPTLLASKTPAGAPTVLASEPPKPPGKGGSNGTESLESKVGAPNVPASRPPKPPSKEKPNVPKFSDKRVDIPTKPVLKKPPTILPNVGGPVLKEALLGVADAGSNGELDKAVVESATRILNTGERDHVKLNKALSYASDGQKYAYALYKWGVEFDGSEINLKNPFDYDSLMAELKGTHKFSPLIGYLTYKDPESAMKYAKLKAMFRSVISPYAGDKSKELSDRVVDFMMWYALYSKKVYCGLEGSLLTDKSLINFAYFLNKGGYFYKRDDVVPAYNLGKLYAKSGEILKLVEDLASSISLDDTQWPSLKDVALPPEIYDLSLKIENGGHLTREENELYLNAKDNASSIDPISVSKDMVNYWTRWVSGYDKKAEITNNKVVSDYEFGNLHKDLIRYVSGTTFKFDVSLKSFEKEFGNEHYEYLRFEDLVKEGLIYQQDKSHKRGLFKRVISWFVGSDKHKDRYTTANDSLENSRATVKVEPLPIDESLKQDKMSKFNSIMNQRIREKKVIKRGKIGPQVRFF